MYPKREDLKERMHKAGLTYHDVAVALNEPPSTVASRINGNIIMTQESEAKIVSAIEAEEKKKSI